MASNDDSTVEDIDLENLFDMDIVLFQRKANKKNEKLEIGAIQEDGLVAPISAWTLESAFPNSDTLEFLVDEEDRFPGLTSEDIQIVKVIPENKISYGSRQVGGGKGPGNPHGEESEILYYVDRDALKSLCPSTDGEDKYTMKDVEIVVKPELEILW
eukprot:CAMPEP_0178976948 /NCGR_PEP_ID=MMETSP0789-20121207/24175_1 /TAXON_ID=3005 /ORGANISM="Rhizosolenia setigera, Strain CCMP 1694" /LENGTH=156 /DNA_ID=CAMNT_0020666209 /DNA_START=165 /DNA_END=635 /DNA_ORIENTATION=+